MRSGIARGEDGAPGVTRRVVRLFVLLGAVFATYLVLSLFDHAARADAGSIDQPISRLDAIQPAASVDAIASGAGKIVPVPKSKSTASKTYPQKIHQSTNTVPTVHPPKVHRPKVQAPKRTPAVQDPVQTSGKALASGIRGGEPVRRVQVKGAVRATVTTAETVVRQNLPTPVRLPALLDLPQVELPSWSQLPGLPEAPLPSMPQLPGLPQAPTPAQAGTAAFTRVSVPHLSLLPPVPVPAFPLLQPPAFAPVSGPSDVTRPPTAPAQPRTAPLPAPLRQPGNSSTPTGQARDSGGGNAPATGTVSSSWRPEGAAAGRRPAIDIPARGRTVRYAGPPS